MTIIDEAIKQLPHHRFFAADEPEVRAAIEHAVRRCVAICELDGMADCKHAEQILRAAGLEGKP